MQADNVGNGEQRVELDITAAQAFEFGTAHRVDSEERAAEPRHDPGEGEANAAGADDPHGAAVEVKAEKAVQREIALPDTRVGAADPAVEGQDQRRRMLGDRVRRISGHPGDRDPEFLCCRKVDIVEPRTAQRDEPRAAVLQSREHVAVDLVVDKRTYGRSTLGQSRRRRVQMRLEICNVVRRARGRVRRVE